MRCLVFAQRNRKEIMRDPLSIFFGIGFPVVLLLLINLMKSSIKNMPVDLFPINTFAPGMAVFGLSFISLFLGSLMVTDRSSSFLMRMFSSPLTSVDYILGYSLPLLPVAIIQSIICFGVALLMGLTLNLNLLLALLVLLPTALLFIGLGILLGTVFSNANQVGGIASILVNVSAWLSGTWFDLEIMGGVFKKICLALPFAHSVQSVSAAISGDYNKILPNIAWVLGYAIIIFALSVFLFNKKMKN